MVDLRQRVGAFDDVIFAAGLAGNLRHRVPHDRHAVRADRDGGDLRALPLEGADRRLGGRGGVAVADDDHVLDGGVGETNQNQIGNAVFTGVNFDLDGDGIDAQQGSGADSG